MRARSSRLAGTDLAEGGEPCNNAPASRLQFHLFHLPLISVHIQPHDHDTRRRWCAGF